MNWPPKKPSNNQSMQVTKQSSFSFKLACGETEGRFEFGLYLYVDPSSQEVAAATEKLYGGSGGDGGSAVPHHAVDMQAP